jgi:pyruvate,water dikinase
MAVLELGRRGVEAGLYADPTDVTMLLAAELDGYAADPAAYRELIAERLAGYRELWDIEPPFIIADKVKPLPEWKRREGAKHAAGRPGDVLTGVAGCAGRHTGTARVVMSAEAADDLEPGDVLVAPATDPAWTPLFLIAGAVVVDVGGRNSHAVIISRELGIPCVVSVTGATRAIPDGATVTVDGAAAAVTIEAVAGAERAAAAGVHE